MQPHGRQPTRLPRPWDSPGKNTGEGCHFLLQCMKVKSEREVAQSCLTLSNPMDCSLPGSSVHGIFQARVLEWGAIAFSEEYQSQVLFLTLGYLPVSRIKHASLASSALADRFFTTIATWEAQRINMYYLLSHLRILWRLYQVMFYVCATHLCIMIW